MDAVVRHLHPAGPDPVGGSDGRDADAIVDADAPDAMTEADRQAYWDDLAALRARLAELRAG